MKIAFVGAGSWGTATASLVAAKNHYETYLWARRAELAETINLYHENPEYLPDAPLPHSLRATNDLEEALTGAEVVVMGVPSHGFRAVLKDVSAIAGPRPCYVSLTKGLEVDNRKRMSEVLKEEVEGLGDSCISVLTGPNLAKEVVRGFPAASTVACVDEEVATRLQGIFQSLTFRCYRNTDLIGCELGGALKNVIAIAAGMADGLGFGDNTKATVMTRGLAEMARFGVKFGAHPLTMLGLAGVGDLMATCASPQSRNHFVG
ncbi:MAG: NAD(P)-dependent glycerol-3-phosphate dehydrogenase, partial [Actinomycetota bacterium]|nr:NAD(P)-dependent glycerol-3-phosphate dehydrogenase [Actinomycetota bacterium]